MRAAPAHAALTAGRAHPVEVSAMIRNVTLVDASQRGAAVAVEDSGNALLDNIVIAGDRQSGLGVVYGIRADEQFGHLRIRNVVAPAVGEAGIALVNLSQSGGLDSYTIMKNVATVGARMPTPKWLVEGNL